MKTEVEQILNDMKEKKIIDDGAFTNFYGGKTDNGYKLKINGEQIPSKSKQGGLMTKTCFNSTFKTMHMHSEMAKSLFLDGTLDREDNTRYTILQIMLIEHEEVIMELIETDLYLGELPFA